MRKPFRLNDFDQKWKRENYHFYNHLFSCKVSSSIIHNVALSEWMSEWVSLLILVAVLISGSRYSNQNTHELFLPSTGTSCTLPTSPQLRYYHSVDNNGIMCGSGDFSAWYSCVKWSPNTRSWEELLTLNVQRLGHVSWTPESDMGTYLMGGEYTSWTTVLIKDDGTQESAFALQYSTT